MEPYTGRKKSCTACRKSKARCSLGAPCRRCEERALECKYESLARRSAPRALRSAAERSETNPRPAAASPATQNTPVGSRTEVSERPGLGESADIQSGFEDLDLFTTLPGDAETFSASNVPGVAEASGASELNLLDPCRNSFEFSPMMRFGLPQGTSISPNILGFQSMHSFQHDKEPCLNRLSAAAPCQDSPVPDDHGDSGDGQYSPTIPQFCHRRFSLAPRKRRTVSTCFTSRVILGQLLSYPNRIAKGSKLPPFIFPPCAKDGLGLSVDCCAPGHHQCLPEALAICSSLVQSFEKRTPGSASFVWKNIYMEIERLHIEVRLGTGAPCLCSLLIQSRADIMQLAYWLQCFAAYRSTPGDGHLSLVTSNGPKFTSKQQSCHLIGNCRGELISSR